MKSRQFQLNISKIMPDRQKTQGNENIVFYSNRFITDKTEEQEEVLRPKVGGHTDKGQGACGEQCQNVRG